MNYRVLCDENVPESVVSHLERDDIDATHVTADPGTGTSDDLVATYARDRDCLLLTNDDDFLDDAKFPEIKVLYYPDNSVPAHVLARRVEDLVSLVSEPDDLGRVTFLTEN